MVEELMAIDPITSQLPELAAEHGLKPESAQTADPEANSSERVAPTTYNQPDRSLC